MNDILRTFRLGVVNLLGVTVPGLILLFLLVFGCIAPSLLLVGEVDSRFLEKREPAIVSGNNQVSSLPALSAATSLVVPGTAIQVVAASTNSTSSAIEAAESRLEATIKNLPPIGHIPAPALLATILILAYVIGYVFRLSSPDELDQKSARKVLAKMKTDGTPSVEDKWPYQDGDEKNKFPYFHFKEYLDHRNHKELLKYVRWDEKVRSKTFVNKMKLETSVRCPQLSAIIESNEAHIRMLFGTWSACRSCQKLLMLGISTSALGCLLSLVEVLFFGSHDSQFMAFVIWLVITLFLRAAISKGSERIEALFHYRRVRELFDVVACYHLACEGFDAAGQPQGRAK